MSFRPLRDLPDQELLDAFKTSSHNEYLGELFHRYSHVVFFICHKYLRDARDAEDAAMEVFELMAGKIRKWEGSSFKAWLWSLTKNYCLSKSRKNKVSVLGNAKEYQDSSEVFMHFSDFERLVGERKEILLQHLEEAVRQLDEPQKKCVELFYFQDKSLKEIMGITDCTWDQVRSHLQNARRNIKIFIERKASHAESIGTEL
jgi:RNA polymerase sigma factor (sigma-70 family)